MMNETLKTINIRFRVLVTQSKHCNIDVRDLNVALPCTNEFGFSIPGKLK